MEQWNKEEGEVRDKSREAGRAWEAGISNIKIGIGIGIGRVG